MSLTLHPGDWVMIDLGKHGGAGYDWVPVAATTPTLKVTLPDGTTASVTMRDVRGWADKDTLGTSK
jgi:hypothetical protein